MWGRSGGRIWGDSRVKEKDRWERQRGWRGGRFWSEQGNKDKYTGIRKEFSVRAGESTRNTNGEQSKRTNEHGKNLHDEEGWQKNLPKKRRQHIAKPQQHAIRRFTTAAIEKAYTKAFQEHRCFRCLTTDHKRAQCRDPMKCFQCHKFGHTSIKCRATTIKTNPAPTYQAKISNAETEKAKITYAQAVRGVEKEKQMEEEVEPFLEERPEEENIFLPSRTRLGPYNKYLERSAGIVLLRGAETPTLPAAIAAELAQRHGGEMHNYRVYKDSSIPYMRICEDENVRDMVVEQGPCDIPTLRVQFGAIEWNATWGMAFQQPGYEIWLKLIGLPLQLWNSSELNRVTARVGTIQETLPYGEPGRQLEHITMRVASKHPRHIPRYLRMRQGDYAKRVRVKILGWRIVQSGDFPLPQPQPAQCKPRKPLPNYHQHQAHYQPPPPHLEHHQAQGAVAMCQH